VLRADLLDAAAKAGVTTVAQGCYGTTQGPRLETSAEIARMARDGSDLVGMTGMPEAALASEAGLCYATCAVVANWAAGLEETPILMEDIEKQLSISMKLVIEILMQLNMR
jgi:5'-methylthioinosine phosphorylase